MCCPATQLPPSISHGKCLRGIVVTSAAPADPMDSLYVHLLHAPGHKLHRPPPLESSSSSHPSAEPSPDSQNGWDGIQTSSQAEIPEEQFTGHPVDTTTPPIAQEFPSAEPHIMHAAQNGGQYDVSASDSKLQKPPPSLPFRRQMWHGPFGNGDKSHLPPVDELQAVSQSQSGTPSLKWTQSSSTDSRLLPEVQSPLSVAPPPKDLKKVKKEAARMAREVELQRCAQMTKAQQEQSRAITQARSQIIVETDTKQALGWKSQSHAHLVNSLDASRLEHNGPRNGGGPIWDHLTHGDSAIGLGTV